MTQQIHLIAPAGTLQSFYEHLGVHNGAAMVSRFQEIIGSRFKLTANLAILDACEDESGGGRSDDRARAQDITVALGNSNVAAILAVRGGAWFTRILGHIDFSVLDRRIFPIMVFGFSELTPLINIVANHPMGIGIHDMGPAFLVYGLKRYASLNQPERTDRTPEQWMADQLTSQIAKYLKRMAETVASLRPPAIPIGARLMRGAIADGTRATFVGGNLTVLSTLLGSPFGESIAPGNHWLVLEDFNDKLERLDRFLAHFTLADYWNRCEGLLLGDFHRGETDHLSDILAILEYHITDRDFPVLATSEIGHVWPMTPLPLHCAGQWRSTATDSFNWVLE
jgi:muramoyltetrapeptide carboxypeptidase LdcA involved in peptidoglycan recycling